MNSPLFIPSRTGESCIPHSAEAAAEGRQRAEGAVLAKSARQTSEQLQHLIPCLLAKQMPFCQGTGEGQPLQK